MSKKKILLFLVSLEAKMFCRNNKVEDEEMCISQKKIKDEEKKDEEEEEGMGKLWFLF